MESITFGVFQTTTVSNSNSILGISLFKLNSTYIEPTNLILEIIYLLHGNRRENER